MRDFKALIQSPWKSVGVLPVKQQTLPNGKLLDYDKEVWLWQGHRSTVGPGPPRLGSDISLADHARTAASKNSFWFPQKIITQKYWLPTLYWSFFGFIAYCSLPALPMLAKPSIFFWLGHLNFSVVFLSLTWWICKQASGKHRPKCELWCRWLSHTLMPVIQSQQQH